MRKKKKDNPIDFGSYSDLFMVMSFVFLFMYVVSSINTGITVIQERHRADKDRKSLETTVAKYEKKIDTELDEEQKREYDRLREGLLKLKADAREAREYQEKMAQAAREKEKELDLYQETIKVMMVDQLKVNEKIKAKDEIIAKVKEETDQVIKHQERAIASLKEDIVEKEKVITERAQEIQTRTAEINQIEKRVDELKHKAVLAENQAKELQQLTLSLNEKEAELDLAKQTEANLKKEKEKLFKASLVQVNKLNREKEQIAQSSKADIDRIMEEKQKLFEESKAERERLESDKASMISSKEAEIAQLRKDKDSELKSLAEKYKKATEGLRKEIAGTLASKLRDSGINASVNTSTGDVTVMFKHAYYDYNSSVLKETMKEELKSFIPLYAKALFENAKYASSISTVEIIGSSSPSFKGKYVNPRAMASVEERKAMTYNLDLSYRRAKSIFDFTFLSHDLAFEHKDEMIPLIKVAGTGYLQAMDELVALPVEKQDKNKGFCGMYNCEVFQKVTLRFNLKDKVTQK